MQRRFGAKNGINQVVFCRLRRRGRHKEYRLSLLKTIKDSFLVIPDARICEVTFFVSSNRKGLICRPETSSWLHRLKAMAAFVAFAAAQSFPT